MSDLNTQLREYLEATAPPVGLKEILSDEVWVPAADAPRRVRWTLPRWVYGVAAMVLVLGLTLGLALLVPGTHENEVVDEPTPTTITNDPAPDLSGTGGSLNTPLGPITWIHGTDIGLFPHLGVIGTPSGFAGITEVEVPDGQDVSLWLTSSDGVTWTEAAFPVPLDPQAAVLLGETHGRSWLTDGARLWLSDDGAVWTEIDFSDVTPPPSLGVEWFPRFEPPAVNGDLALFPLQLTPELPLREIFDPRSEFTGGIYGTNCGWDWQLDACQDVADDVNVVFGLDPDTREETLLARFRLEAGDETAYVVDVDTGSQLHEFWVADLNGEQLTQISGLDLNWNALVLVGSAPTTNVVEPPWSAFDLQQTVMAAVDGRFLAYVDGGDPHGPTTLDAIEVWESEDGLTWTSRGIVDFGIESSGEVDLMLFEDGGGRLVTVISELDGSMFPTETRLISSDGLNWEPYAPDEPDIRGTHVEGGFVSLGEDAVLVSDDGDQWEELISWSPRRGNLAFIGGDTLIVALESDFTFEVWAFDLQP